MAFNRKFWAAPVGAVVLLMSGCASYYSHYGSFSAENSSGELRQYLVSWQTAEYPDWWFQGNQSTPLTLKTQCSERTIRFMDAASGPRGGECVNNPHSIAWCADSSLDRPDPVAANRDGGGVCGWVEAGDANSITQIGHQLQVYIQCRPAQVQVGSGDDLKNLDYLKASSVPYSVTVRKVSRGSWDDRPPVLDEKICALDGH